MTTPPASPAISEDLRAEMRDKATAAVAEWPELTGEQLTEIRRILGGPDAPHKTQSA